MVNGEAAKQYLAEFAKTFGDSTSTAETLGEFRYDTPQRRRLPL